MLVRGHSQVLDINQMQDLDTADLIDCFVCDDGWLLFDLACRCLQDASPVDPPKFKRVHHWQYCVM